ncbi:MAG: amidohydrolase family protein [Firmicutes bacterium]|nr:amidohydrolase family protein [Bacillota bacterium]
MAQNEFRFFDTHIHFTENTPVDVSVESYKKLFALTGVEKAAFLSLPGSTSEGAGPTQNVKALYYKDVFSPNGYAFAGLIHNRALDEEGQSRNLLHQVERYFEAGFDGLKMLEGKPTMRKALRIRLTDGIFDRMFAFLEENHIPITLHNADPATFWDLSKMTPHEISRGWFCDASLPTKDEMFEEVMTIMDRHPRLHLTMAHYGFTSDALDQAQRFLDGYEHTALDTTPGWEQYVNMYGDIAHWQPFLETHAHRIKYGTDSYNVYNPDEKAMTARQLHQPTIIRNFMQGCGEYEIYGHTYGGIQLASELLQKIYYENASKEYGKPKPISKQFVAEEIAANRAEKEQYDLAVIAEHFGV